jgi:hypothetical protein
MNTLRLRWLTTPVLAILATAGLGLSAGCGDDTGLEKRYPVSGTVTYQDQPLAKGQISFIPADPSNTKLRPAAGTIVDGRFSVTTAAAGDGALPGKYKVSIVASQFRPEDEAKIKEVMAKRGGMTRQDETARYTARAKSLIPTKYNSSEMSGLEATVEARPNDFKFNLTD